MTVDFSGKCADMTGGANGIGFAAAHALAAGGAKVWVFDVEQGEDSAGVNTCRAT